MIAFWSTYNTALTPQVDDTARLCYTDDHGEFRNPGIEGRITGLEPLTVEWQPDAHPSFFDVLPANLEARHFQVLLHTPEGVPVRVY